jgi:hypothetical protein
MADEEYQTSDGAKRASDLVVSLGGQMIWFEVTNFRLRMATKVSGDLEAFEDEVIGSPAKPGKLFKKLRQLSKRADDFARARWRGKPVRLAGKTYVEVNRIWPVVVTLESFPLDSFVWDYLRVKIGEWRLLGDSKLAPLQIMNVRNLEEICELGPSAGSLLHLLLSKTASLAGRDESWDNFLYFEFHAKRTRPSVEELKGALEENETLAFVKDTLGFKPPSGP